MTQRYLRRLGWCMIGVSFALVAGVAYYSPMLEREPRLWVRAGLVLGIGWSAMLIGMAGCLMIADPPG